MRRKLYKNAAEKQKAWRQRQSERRLYAIRMWILPPAERARLARDIPWLRTLLRERDELRKRLDEAERLATIGRSAEAEINQLLDQVAKLEQRERRREQNRNRKRRHREGGILLPSDPRAIVDHYQADRPSAFAPTITPISGQIDPTDWTRSRQDQDTIGPRIGQDRDTIAPIVPQRSAFRQPSPSRPAPAPREVPWWIEARVQISSPAPTSAPAPDKELSSLLDRIKRNGYRVNASNGTVFYDNRWIPADEWVRRMPDVLS